MVSLLGLELLENGVDLAALPSTLRDWDEPLYVVTCRNNDTTELTDLCLTELARLFDVVAQCRPRLNLVPLLPVVGWTLGGYSAFSISQAVKPTVFNRSLAIMTLGAAQALHQMLL